MNEVIPRGFLLRRIVLIHVVPLNAAAIAFGALLFWPCVHLSGCMRALPELWQAYVGGMGTSLLLAGFGCTGLSVRILVKWMSDGLDISNDRARRDLVDLLFSVFYFPIGALLLYAHFGADLYKG